MKEIINKFWSEDADNYSKSVIRSMHSTKEKNGWQETFTEVFGKEKLNVLDVGTGPGIIAFLLAELGHDVTGVDLSEEMLRKAMENATHFDLSVEFKHGDAENLPFEDESFDAVINRAVLWTLPNPEKAIAEWRRVLKTGGKIVIVDGNWYLSNEFRSFNRRAREVLAILLVLITERKDIRKSGSYSNVVKKLWSTNKKRPDADIEILENLGFNDIIVREGINHRIYPFLENLKLGYWGDTFLVSGVKQ